MHKKDLGLGIGAFILGVALFLYFNSIPSGSAFYPRMICVAIMILGCMIAGSAITGAKKEAEQAEAPEKKKEAAAYPVVAIIVGYLLGYYFLFQILGYTIPTFLLVTLTSATLGYRKWKVLIPSAAIVSIGLYLVFTQLFNIRFPGIFF